MKANKIRALVAKGGKDKKPYIKGISHNENGDKNYETWANVDYKTQTLVVTEENTERYIDDVSAMRLP